MKRKVISILFAVGLIIGIYDMAVMAQEVQERTINETKEKIEEDLEEELKDELELSGMDNVIETEEPKDVFNSKTESSRFMDEMIKSQSTVNRKEVELGVSITPKFDVNHMEIGVKHPFILSITNPSDKILENIIVTIDLYSPSGISIAQGRFVGVSYPYPDGEEETDIYTTINKINPYETVTYSCTIMVSEGWTVHDDNYSLDINVGDNIWDEESLFVGGASLDVKLAEKHTHIYKKIINKASLTHNGKIIQKCSICGNIVNQATIYYPEIVELFTTDITYNGKTHTPLVNIVGSDRKTIDSSNYTVSYASGRKKIGHYKVTITFKGNYSGTVTKTFNINPKGTKLSKVKAAKKKATVKWKKQTKDTKGYQIQYSTNKNFNSGVKTKTVNGSKKTSVTLKGLKSKKTYYVRIRTYQNVSGGKCYSTWSGIKKVKIK